MESQTSHIMTHNFTVYTTEINGKKRVKFAKSDTGIYMSDQNRHQGKIVTDPNLFAELIKTKWFPKLDIKVKID
jgi:hypothetical protein